MLKTRSAALAVLALISAMLIGIYAISSGPVNSADAASLPRSEQADEEAGNSVATEIEEPVISSEAVRKSVEQEPAVAPEKTPSPTPALRITGRLIIEELDGSQTTDADGTLEILLWRKSSGKRLRTAVIDGAFDIEFFRVDGGYVTTAIEEQVLAIDRFRDGWTVRSLKTDGGGLTVGKHEGHYSLDPEPVVLRAKRNAAVLLHVRDAATGTPLDGLTVLNGRGRSANRGRAHPWLVSKGDIEHDAARSPVALRGRSGSGSIFVRAPGYAWGRIELDLENGGERTLELSPGGSIEVALTGDIKRRGAILRLRSEGQTSGSPVLQLDVHGKKVMSAEGIPVGIHTATVELGEYYDRHKTVLATGVVEIHAGQQATLTLDIDTTEPIEKAALSGTLIVPAEWDLSTPSLQGKLIGPALNGGDGRLRIRRLEPLPGSVDTWTWSAGQVQLGHYILTYSPLEYSIGVDVDAAGATNVVMEVPPPVDVTVRFENAVTGEAILGGSLHWSCKRPEKSSGGGLESVSREEGAESFECKLPRSEIVLSTWNTPGYGPGSITVDLASGRNEVVLELTPTHRLELRLRDGDKIVPWPNSSSAHVTEFLDGELEFGMSGSRGNLRFFELKKPGRYVIKIPPVPGFEPVERYQITVGPGHPIEAFVDLVKVP